VRKVSVVVSAMLVLLRALPRALRANTSEGARQALTKLILGKEVKALLQLPATKEGLNVYVGVEQSKRLDERGIDDASLAKCLRSKGVGVNANEWASATTVEVEYDRVEVYVMGGAEGRHGGRAVGAKAAYQRAGGARINFVYNRQLYDSDLEPETFVRVMSRIFDVTQLQNQLAIAEFPLEFQQAIAENTVKEGMTYQMVLFSFGDPEQKKINDTADGSLSETWYYMKEGHRWVLTFTNGKVTKVQAY